MTESRSEMSERGKRLAARDERIKSLTPRRPTIQVEPTRDDYRKHLKHPNGKGFPEGSGAANWPDDRFTRRRIADGSVKAVEHQRSASSRPQRSPRAERGSEATS